MSLPGKQWFSWTRLACLVATALLLWLAFRKIDAHALLESLRQMRPGWVVTAVVLYGAALAASAFRWHMALRSTERAIHFLATWRLSLVGHFLFIALFGAVGGDAAKSAIHARWFRFALPEVLAAAPLDRALSLAGALVLAVATGVAALASGGVARLQHVQFRQPGVLAITVLCVLTLAVAAIVFWKPRGENSFARTIRALRSGGWLLAISPRLALPGVGSAILAQSALSAVFACNLAAVSTGAIPWAQLAWTIPAITTLSCLPFTFAGAGVREVAALTLLGLYGVPAADCVAASMLTLVLKLGWAGVGAGVFWREQGRQERCGSRELASSISVVIPTLNEADAICETVHRVRANPEVTEIIVVDGGSADGTTERAAALGCRVLNSCPGRGQQLRLGASAASGDVVLLLHADTWLPPDAARAALNCLRDATVVAGGFWKIYQGSPLPLAGSRLKCAIRLLVTGRVLGDQGMFVRRATLELIGGVPEMELMEEFELCHRLRKAGRLSLAEATVVTSARRFAKQGVLRVTARSWWLALRYRLGTPVQELRRIYEKD